MTRPALPKCPRCNTAKQVSAVGLCGDMFRCGRCGGLFDDDPNEGGDYSDRDPAARLDRAERRQNQRSMRP